MSKMTPIRPFLKNYKVSSCKLCGHKNDEIWKRWYKCDRYIYELLFLLKKKGVTLLELHKIFGVEATGYYEVGE